MAAEDVILVGKGQTPQDLHLGLANRHGLIAGATGTGKTVTLQVLAEGLSDAGVPVFCADVKGDLSGISQAGDARAEARRSGPRWSASPTTRPQACPVVFWDLFGEQGHPVRATISEMGPLLLARLLGLNETQDGVLQRGVPGRRRPGPAAARPQGPARAPAFRRRARRRTCRSSTAGSAPPR